MALTAVEIAKLNRLSPAAKAATLGTEVAANTTAHGTNATNIAAAALLTPSHIGYASATSASSTTITGVGCSTGDYCLATMNVANTTAASVLISAICSSADEGTIVFTYSGASGGTAGRIAYAVFEAIP